MAVPAKRLFWISIIVVELVLGYVLWRPVRDHLRRSHRAAVTTPALKRPEIPQPQAQKPKQQPELKAAGPGVASPARPSSSPSKPWAGIRSVAPTHPKSIVPSSIVVNAGLKTPEPIPAKPTVTPPPTAGLAESFWCHISMVQPQCDCKKGNEQASNLVQQ
jgi:hypothetical protein